MSGVGFSEFLILCLIGLVVLGPKRLPEVANQIGSWIGQARRMTRVMKRQLEEELDLNKPMNTRPAPYTAPHDDDTFSPLHEQPESVAALDLAAGSDLERDAVEALAEPPHEEPPVTEQEETASERPKDS